MGVISRKGKKTDTNIKETHSHHIQMYCVLVSRLPLGVTPNALKRCIEEALNDRPVFPQNPKIIEDEALVYLPARDIAIKLASKTVTVRCGGIVVKVKRISEQEANEWLLKHAPAKKKNP